MAAVSVQVVGLERTVVKHATKDCMVPTVSYNVTAKWGLYAIASMEHVDAQKE